MGKGVSYMEDDYKWHGIPPDREQAEQALREMGTSSTSGRPGWRATSSPRSPRGAFLVSGATPAAPQRPPCPTLSKAGDEADREGFGHGLLDLGQKRPEVVVLVGDLSDRRTSPSSRRNSRTGSSRWAVAEQNMMCVGRGPAARERIPFLATYGAFASCRSADQMRVTVRTATFP